LKKPVPWGALAWLSAGQYFIVQLLVARLWPVPYSFTRNFISDLGNTSCGWSTKHAQLWICSPAHHWMNASFVLLGITTAAGALLLRKQLLPNRLGLLSTAAFVASALGIAMVGLNPENLAGSRHIAGAYLDCYGSVMAIGLFGFSLKQQRRLPGLANFSLVSAGFILLTSMVYLVNYYFHVGSLLELGLGEGGSEKLNNYPIYLWQISVGLFLLRR
jgi:hypothetical membrane protein